MSPVLVTGGSGYLATHLIAELLEAGRPVRATVRSTSREAELAAQHARLGYLREKAALWDARERGDAEAEAEATRRVVGAVEGLGVLR